MIFKRLSPLNSGHLRITDKISVTDSRRFHYVCITHTMREILIVRFRRNRQPSANVVGRPRGRLSASRSVDAEVSVDRCNLSYTSRTTRDKTRDT